MELRTLEGMDRKLGSMEARLGIMAGALGRLQAETASVRAAQEEANSIAVTQNLQWAMQHLVLSGHPHNGYIALGHFLYGVDPMSPCSVSSTNLVIDMLQRFMQGQGGWLSREFWTGPPGSIWPVVYPGQPAEGLDLAQQAFRDALCKQIHLLTGRMPQINLEPNGEIEQYAIRF